MSIVSEEMIRSKVYLIRGHKVMLDKDLANLYDVTTGNLNLAVKRNNQRFPADFMFQLTKEEYGSLILQIAISKTGKGGCEAPSICLYRTRSSHVIQCIK